MSPISLPAQKGVAMFLLVACLLVSIDTFAAEPKTGSTNRLAAGSAPPRTYQPRLVRTLEFKDYGSSYLRLGDLDGDGVPDVLLAQGKSPGGENKVIITCLTALDLEGRILWQVGTPDIENSRFTADLPVQIYDIDHDGTNEVIYIPDEHNVLMILDGRTGKEKRHVQLAGGHDSLLFADFAGRGWAQELLVKDRYENFWVYGADFNLLWSKTNVNTGHYPMNFDFDGDGRDELLCGYTLYDHNGKELWSHPEFGVHDDAVYIEDMDGDGHAEIAIATSTDAVLLNDQGKVLFRKKMGHCQHALIGKFRADLPGKQVCFLDRFKINAELYDEPRQGVGPWTVSHKLLWPKEVKDRKSEVSLFTMSGELLARIEGNIWVAGILRVDNWTGNPNENFVCLYGRGFAPPALFDGYGREVATFPFPAAIVNHGADGQDIYENDFVQHLDCYGDEREEILVFNHKELRIYTNPALWQKPRLFNNNYYPGRL